MHHTVPVSVNGNEPARPRSARRTTQRPGTKPRTIAPVSPEVDLLVTQQMSNVGLLAAGLAHDLNNLLTVIFGSAELARDALPAPSPVRHHLSIIETTVRRAGEMCRAMLACARTDQQRLEPVDANAVVRDTVALLQSSRLAFHRVQLVLAANLPPALANPAQFRQVVLNLLANAAEACGPCNGRIRVSTSVVQLDPHVAPHLRPTGVAPGRFLRLRVADDGCGMDATTQERLFTPFFTHKGPGRGLGLASLLAIARAHGGGVRVFSEPQRGSIFDVFLPLGTAPGDPISAPPADSSASVPRVSGTVLIADDEEILRTALATFLTAQGLTVHTVENGEAALAHLAAHPWTDLVLIDLVMPKVGGLEALTALRAAGLRTPVILMTGHSDLELADQISGLAPAVVFAKPFSLAALLRSIGELLPQQRPR